MSVRRWVRDNAFPVSVVVFLVSAALLTAVVGYAGLVLVSALLSEAALLSVALDLAVPYLPVAATLLVVAVVSGVGVAWGLGRRLSGVAGRGLDALGEWAAGVERERHRYHAGGGSDGWVGSLLGTGAGEHADGDAVEAALADLRRRYVEGTIGEREFERRLDRLVAEGDLDEDRASRERTRVAEQERQREGHG